MKTTIAFLLSCLSLSAQNLLPPGAEPQKSPDHVRLSWIAPYTNASSIIVLYQRVGTNFALRAYGYTNDLWLLSLPGTTNYVDFAKTNLVSGATNRFRLVELRQSRYWTIESGTTNLVEREMLEESLPTNEILWVPQQLGPTNLFLMLEIQSAPTVDGPWSAESTVSANVPLNNRNPLFTRVKIVEQAVQ